MKRIVAIVALTVATILPGCTLEESQIVQLLLQSRETPAVVQTALNQVGDPYKWGSSGPNSFDCSGLIHYSYAQNGRIVPRTSRSLRSVSMRIPASEARPGDLVFSGNPVHHVGIYVGGGRMVHAPGAGRRVEISMVSGRSFFGRLD